MLLFQCEMTNTMYIIYTSTASSRWTWTNFKLSTKAGTVHRAGRTAGK